MGGVMLSDVSEVFTHPFTQCSFDVPNVLFQAHLTSDTIDDSVGFATTRLMVLYLRPVIGLII